VERAFDAEKATAPVPYRELGSVEGFVSKAELDGLGRAVLRFWARTNGAEVKAIATGEAFKQLEELRLSDVWHGVRVRVYGTISYKGLGVIDGLVATGIEVLDRSQLPGIDDIVDPTFTGGLSAEDFLANQRKKSQCHPCWKQCKMVTPKKTPLTDAERHERFKAMAREVEADKGPASFDRAFASVVTPPKPKD
jgi:hypothetical protein